MVYNTNSSIGRLSVEEETMKKRLLCFAFVVILAFAGTVSAQSLPTEQPCSRAKSAARGALLYGMLGAAAGAASNPNHAQGAWRGAAAFGPVGAVKGAREAGCYNKKRGKDRGLGYSSVRGDGPRKSRYPRAGESVANNESRPAVRIRRVDGANRSAVSTVLSQDLEIHGYDFVDPDNSQAEADFYVDVVVRRISQRREQKGSGLWGGIVNADSDRAIGEAEYRVSITTYDFSTGKNARGKSGSVVVLVVNYQSNSGYYNVFFVHGRSYGYGYMNDPASEAAARGIDYLFSSQ